MAPLKQLVTFFGLAFSALLPLVNPLGSALVFLALVGDAPPDVYRRLARTIAINTTLFLIVVEVIGTAVLKFFGISLPVMQVSGGLVIASMGWSLLNQGDTKKAEEQKSFDERRAASLEGQVFYPFTFPLTAGPGCIVVMVTLSAHAAAEGDVMLDLLAYAGIVLAVLLLSAAVNVCYGSAPAIAQRVRPETAHGILRVIAFVLMCIGVQITWNGVEALIRPLLHQP
jgi:multiple antibiotic resistance protein